MLITSIPVTGMSCANCARLIERKVGALAGVVGSMMALEAVKRITGAGEPLVGRLWVYDGLAGESRTVRIGPDPHCPVCGSGLRET